MMGLDVMRKELHDRRLHVVSEETGISYGILLNIRDNPLANPKYRDALALSDYLVRLAVEAGSNG